MQSRLTRITRPGTKSLDQYSVNSSFENAIREESFITRWGGGGYIYIW